MEDEAVVGEVEVKCEIIEISDEEVNLGPKKRKQWVFFMTMYIGTRNEPEILVLEKPILNVSYVGTYLFIYF